MQKYHNHCIFAFMDAELMTSRETWATYVSFTTCISVKIISYNQGVDNYIGRTW